MSEYVMRPKRTNDLWLSEYSTDNLKLSMRVKSLLHTETTQYQDMLIADTYEYGRVLMLDGAFQLTEKDEFTYSEMMAHVPLCAHPNPEKVLIIGGGDGAIMREVLKHECVKKCTLIDIDERVIACSKEYLPFAGCSFICCRYARAISSPLFFRSPFPMTSPSAYRSRLSPYV